MIVYAEDFFDEYKNTCYPFTGFDRLLTITGKTVPITLIQDCNIYSLHPGPIFLSSIVVSSTVIIFNFSNTVSPDIITSSVNPFGASKSVAYDNAGRISGFIYFDIDALNELKSWPNGQYLLLEEDATLVPSCFRTLIATGVTSVKAHMYDSQSTHICIFGGPGIILEQATIGTNTTITVNIPGEEVNAVTYKPITLEENKNFIRQRYIQPKLLKQLRVVGENEEILLIPSINDPASRVQLYSKISSTGGNRLRITSTSNSIKITLVGETET